MKFKRKIAPETKSQQRFITKKTSKIILGDIVISLEKIMKESKLQKKQFSVFVLHFVAFCCILGEFVFLIMLDW